MTPRGNEKMTPVAMKVWSPDKGMTKKMSIATDEDEIGNKVAEGVLSKEEYWEALAQSRLLSIVHHRKQIVRIRKVYDANMLETSWLIRLAYRATRWWRSLV